MEKIKVLLVDDDLDFGNTAVLLLKKAGYEVYYLAGASLSDA